jgi:serine/threonine protein kinase
VATVKLLDPTDARRRLDRYELIGEIASGGMATVFLARLAGVGGFQRFVAIKRLHPHLANEQEFVEMFLDEARLAAGIHHQHVVPILEVGTSDAGFYLVMEYIEGDTLARIVARALSQGAMVPRPVLLRSILDTLAGLHAAHQLADVNGNSVQLVHRDVSPQNILVGTDGCSRITDFGVARASSRLSTTRADRLKGKIAYMSPEQAKGVDIDHRADVFATGIILWEVLAGRRLFKAENEAATLSRVLIEPIPRLHSIAPDVHPAIDEVVSRALERDVSIRFQSAAEMADALERAAREAAQATADIGVASPREVAAYVASVLGTEIAQQRESVRSWLSQSESSAPKVRQGSAPPQAPKGGATLVSRSDHPPPPEPRVSVEVLTHAGSPEPPPKPKYDVTIKLPLNKRDSTPPTSPDRPLARRPLPALPPGLGAGPRLPPPPPLGLRGPVSALISPPSPPASPPTPIGGMPGARERIASPPSSGTMVGIGPDAQAVVEGPPPVPMIPGITDGTLTNGMLGHGSANGSANGPVSLDPKTDPNGAGSAASVIVDEATSRDEEELSDLSNEIENDHDTLLMDRSPTNLVASVPVYVPPPPPSMPMSGPIELPVKKWPLRVAAVILGLLIVLGAFFVLNRMFFTGPPVPAAEPTSTTTATNDTPPPPPPPIPPPKLDTTATATATSQPVQPPTKATNDPPPDHGHGGHARPKQTAEPTAVVTPPPPPPPPPQTSGDELTNPYR